MRNGDGSYGRSYDGCDANAEKENKVQKAADKAMKTMGEVIENLSEEMGLH